MSYIRLVITIVMKTRKVEFAQINSLARSIYWSEWRMESKSS